MKVLFIGGTGLISSACTRLAVERGMELFLLNRGSDPDRARGATPLIADLRDESDRDGMRVVIDLKRDATADVILNQLYRYTPLQSSFGVNMLALNQGRPEQMGLRGLLVAVLAFREEVVVRRTKFELN